MKVKEGWIENMNGDRMDLIVDSRKSPVAIKDLVIGSLLIGTGVIYLMRKSFKSGADSYNICDYETHVALGNIK